MCLLAAFIRWYRYRHTRCGAVEFPILYPYPYAAEARAKEAVARAKKLTEPDPERPPSEPTTTNKPTAANAPRPPVAKKAPVKKTTPNRTGA